MKTQVINLAEPPGQDEFPAYAVIYSSAAYNPFVLSPRAMCWSEGITLARLDDCRSFWLLQQKKLCCNLVDMFDPLLRHHCGEGYIAVFGEHPWQCLLYLYYQLSHQGRGLYRLQGRLDRNIYRSLGWSCWFDAQAGLVAHLLATNARGFEVQAFHRAQARMQRFIHRIGVDTPQEMSAADANSITRRFGKWLGLIWRWSFTGSSELQAFPWIGLARGQLPRVSRDLEYPVNQWSFIEVLLREDLTRLAGQFQRDDCVHINRMDWEIVLFNDQKITVELSFRHPYALHRDAPGFTTALYQARYIYDDLMRKLQAREHDLDLPDNMPFLRWQIEIREQVVLAPRLLELFAAESDQIDFQQIMSLQNKLPLAFECFQASASFYPEQSFVQTPLGVADVGSIDHYPWSCAAVNKPLFYYPTPLPMDNPRTGASPVQRIFLERNSSQWWLSPEGLQSIRDYFMLKDRDGRRCWAYCNQDGEWFKQGEYC